MCFFGTNLGQESAPWEAIEERWPTFRFEQALIMVRAGAPLAAAAARPACAGVARPSHLPAPRLLTDSGSVSRLVQAQGGASTS